MEALNRSLKAMKRFNQILIFVAITLFIIGIPLTFVHGQGQGHNINAEKAVETASASQSKSINPGLGFIAIALATGLSTIGAGIAVSNVGSAAIGSITEKPELFGRSLIFVGLAEGIAIYGLIISILLLTKI